MHRLWITRLFPLGATRTLGAYIGHRKGIGRTSDQSAMTRRTARDPEDGRDDQFVFRKKRKRISRSMIGESPKWEGASRNGSDRLDHQVTRPIAGRKPKRRSASGHVENHRPSTYWPGNRTPNKRPPESQEEGSPNRGAAGAYLRVSSRFFLPGWRNRCLENGGNFSRLFASIDANAMPPKPRSRT